MPTAPEYEQIPALIAAITGSGSILPAGQYTSIITITNISNQNVQVNYGTIPAQKASENSELPPSKSGQLSMQSGSSIRLETKRVSIGQLDQLRRKRLLTYSIT